MDKEKYSIKHNPAMKINILATHRFHLLDLARELEKQGHDVTFYSYVSKKRCRGFGYNGEVVCFQWIYVPFYVLSKLTFGNKQLAFKVIQYRNRVIDWYVSHIFKDCDVLIALGCIYTKSILKAKRNGSITVLEWGSKHIIEQLSKLGRTDSYPKDQLASDLNEYEIVDYIAIPATHVRDSFIKHGIKEDKLLVNPYGVSLDQFSPTSCTGEFDIISVGGWRFEKGSDLLLEVCKKYGYRLLHVGSLINMEFPEYPNFVHVDPVDQSKLIEYYKRARIFVLPSRSEGLSLVQAQAIACGLPVVCSKETGGIDLRNQLPCKEWIIEMDELSVENLHICIENGLALANGQVGIRDYAGSDINQLSWDAYGKRYSQNLINVYNENKRHNN